MSCSASALEQRPVALEVGEAQIGHPGLPDAENLAVAAKLEVHLGELEAVARPHERLEAFPCVLGQLLLRVRDEDTEGLLRPAPDAATQLVELRQAEAV